MDGVSVVDVLTGVDVCLRGVGGCLPGVDVCLHGVDVSIPGVNVSDVRLPGVDPTDHVLGQKIRGLVTRACGFG